MVGQIGREEIEVSAGPDYREEVNANWALQTGGGMSSLMGKVAPLTGGVLLMAAGAFQWTSLKNACLDHCRSPMSFLMHHWREGTAGATMMGLLHGAYCLGFGDRVGDVGHSLLNHAVCKRPAITKTGDSKMSAHSLRWILTDAVDDGIFGIGLVAAGLVASQSAR